MGKELSPIELIDQQIYDLKRERADIIENNKRFADLDNEIKCDMQYFVDTSETFLNKQEQSEFKLWLLIHEWQQLNPSTSRGIKIKRYQIVRDIPNGGGYRMTEIEYNEFYPPPMHLSFDSRERALECLKWLRMHKYIKDN